MGDRLDVFSRMLQIPISTNPMGKSLLSVPQFGAQNPAGL